MAPTLASLKAELATKNKLITTMIGYIACCSFDKNVAAQGLRVPEKRPDGTEYEPPSAAQRTAYIETSLDQIERLGREAGLWQTRAKAIIHGYSAMMIQIEQEEEAELTTKLQHAAAGMNHMLRSWNVKQNAGGQYVPAKRKRQEELADLEHKLDDAMQSLQNFKKAKEARDSPAPIAAASGNIKQETIVKVEPTGSSPCAPPKQAQAVPPNADEHASRCQPKRARPFAPRARINAQNPFAKTEHTTPELVDTAPLQPQTTTTPSLPQHHERQSGQVIVDVAPQGARRPLPRPSRDFNFGGGRVEATMMRNHGNFLEEPHDADGGRDDSDDATEESNCSYS